MAEAGTSATPPITGGCLCGAVRYSIAAAPIGARSCWCRLCQALGGGSATVNVSFPSEALTVTGDTNDHVSTADSGNVMHRRFCPKCGTPLFSQAEARPHLIVVRAGSLDDPEIARPASTIFTAMAPSWACIDPSLPTSPAGAPPVG